MEKIRKQKGNIFDKNIIKKYGNINSGYVKIYTYPTDGAKTAGILNAVEAYASGEISREEFFSEVLGYYTSEKFDIEKRGDVVEAYHPQQQEKLEEALKNAGSSIKEITEFPFSYSWVPFSWEIKEQA